VVTILKVGGSLFDLPELSQQLQSIMETQAGSVLLVGGGGELAEEIRRLDRIHHWPAIVSHRLAMQTLSVSALFLSELVQRPVVRSPQEFQNTVNATRGAVADLSCWPSIESLPPGWDLTSDSLAAWLASELTATRLLLLKSADPPGTRTSLQQLADTQLVDPLFPQYAARLPRIDWINLRDATGNGRVFPIQSIPG